MISERDKISSQEAIEFCHKNRILFGFKFFKNWFLEHLASFFLIPPWRARLHRMRGVNIGKNVSLGYDVIFNRIHPKFFKIKDYAEIGDRYIISAHSGGSLPLRKKYPRSMQPANIGRGVWMAPGCIAIQGVEIGDNSFIGTWAVVNKNIPPSCLAAGVPAKALKKLDEMEV